MTSDTTRPGDYATRSPVSGTGPGFHARPGSNLQFPGVVVLVGGGEVTVVVDEPVAPSPPDVVSTVGVDDAGRVVAVVVEAVVEVVAVGTGAAVPAPS